jgi:hypothetical protein
MSSKPYWHCPDCGGNFDYGERCDCPREETKPIISETLILGIDMSGGKDISAIQIGELVDGKCVAVRTIYGEEAEKTYNILMNRGATIKVP